MVFSVSIKLLQREAYNCFLFSDLNNISRLKKMFKCNFKFDRKNDLRHIDPVKRSP